MLKDEASSFWSGEDWKMDVTDPTGLILFTLVFAAFDAPCVAKRR